MCVSVHVGLTGWKKGRCANTHCLSLSRPDKGRAFHPSRISGFAGTMSRNMRRPIERSESVLNIKFECPSCRQSIEAPPEMGGQTVECPSCKSALSIPSSDLNSRPQEVTHCQDGGYSTIEERLGRVEARLDELKEHISTKAITVVDDSGQERINLFSSDDFHGLGINDASGTVRVLLAVDKAGPSFGMIDESGKTRAMVRVDGNGPSLVISDKRGIPRILLRLDSKGPGVIMADSNGNGRVMITVDDNEPRLYVLDRNQRPEWTAP